VPFIFGTVDRISIEMYPFVCNVYFRPFDTDGDGMSLLSLEEDTNGFQLCAWIPLTKKHLPLPPYKINFWKGSMA